MDVENGATTVAGTPSSDLSPQTRDLVVLSATMEADGVLSLVLADPTGAPLPGWDPGAHLEILLKSGRVRQYSLCGDITDHERYQVAVLREDRGRGGSIEMHEVATPGAQLTVRGPRNHFALRQAAEYLFLAGGVGITPMLPMIQAVDAAGLPWRLVYGGRSLSSIAFRPRLERYPPGMVTLVPQDTAGLPDLDDALAGVGPGGKVYCCGPAGMIAAVEQACDRAGLRPHLHVEHFTGAVVNAADHQPDDTEFDVELARTGAVLRVPVGRTVLDVVRETLPETPFSCEEGYCATCETRVLGGSPDHRDIILTDEERAAGDTMMICVSRCRSERLVLDL